MGKKQKKVLILISGGIDSAACLKYYLDQNFDISTIFINYGQKARQYEFESAKKITDFYNVNLSEISVQLNKEFKSGEIIGRNVFLIFSTIMFGPNCQIALRVPLISAHCVRSNGWHVHLPPVGSTLSAQAI